jgi:hypothetical protein
MALLHYWPEAARQALIQLKPGVLIQLKPGSPHSRAQRSVSADMTAQ